MGMAVVAWVSGGIQASADVAWKGGGGQFSPASSAPPRHPDVGTLRLVDCVVGRFMLCVCVVFVGECVCLSSLLVCCPVHVFLVGDVMVWFC